MSLSGGGTFAANQIQGDVKAYVDASTIETVNSGNVTLEAKDNSAINAKAESGGLTVSGTADIGVSGTSSVTAIAFNAIGWEIDNFAGKAINTLLNVDVADTENSADVQAYITNSDITTADNLNVNATNETQINSTVSNAATSTASALFGAKALSNNDILASNRVSSTAKAYIDSNTTNIINSGAEIILLAEDNSGIYTNSKIVSSSIVTNDGGANIFNDAVGFLTADYSTDDGTQNLNFGDKIRLTSDYNTSPNADLTKTVSLKTGDLVEIYNSFTGKGNIGSVYQYLGSDKDLDLYTENYNDDTLWQEIGKANSVYKYLGTSTTGINLNLKNQTYTDLDYWREVTETQLIPEGNNITSSDSIGISGLVVRNDIKTEVEAYINNATVDAAGNISLTALENATLNATADSSASASGGSA